MTTLGLEGALPNRSALALPTPGGQSSPPVARARDAPGAAPTCTRASTLNFGHVANKWGCDI